MFSNIELALVYDNKEWFSKYHLNEMVNHPIYIEKIEDPYSFRHHLIDYTPFFNTIFIDADTIIFKDISVFFDKQPFCIDGYYDGEKMVDSIINPFFEDPDTLMKRHNLKRLYSSYTGFMRFEKTDFYKQLFHRVLNNDYYNEKVVERYGRGIMPEDYLFNLTISDMELEYFMPIKVFYSYVNWGNSLNAQQDNVEDFYGFTFQGSSMLPNRTINLKNKIFDTLTNIGFNSYPLRDGTYMNITKNKLI